MGGRRESAKIGVESTGNKRIFKDRLKKVNDCHQK